MDSEVGVAEAQSLECLPLGECGLLLRWPQEPAPRLSRRIRALGEALDRKPPPGFVEWVPGLRSFAVYFDPTRFSRAAWVETLTSFWENLPENPDLPVRFFEVPVRYGGDDGPDLAEVADRARLDPEHCIALHAGIVYEVLLVGFAPGFPYLAGLPEALAVPRRTTPRLRVAAGSVAIANRLCGIYPRESPGGWSLVGRTDWICFDPGRSPPACFAIGDQVRFHPEKGSR
jgi:KipI family sensor histidine kinase inhibitor